MRYFLKVTVVAIFCTIGTALPHAQTQLTPRQKANIDKANKHMNEGRTDEHRRRLDDLIRHQEERDWYCFFNACKK